MILIADIKDIYFLLKHLTPGRNTSPLAI